LRTLPSSVSSLGSTRHLPPRPRRSHQPRGAAGVAPHRREPRLAAPSSASFAARHVEPAHRPALQQRAGPALGLHLEASWLRFPERHLVARLHRSAWRTSAGSVTLPRVWILADCMAWPFLHEGRATGMPRGRACGYLERAMLPLADVSPILLTDRRPPVPGPGWIYELKHDGYRVTRPCSRRQGRPSHPATAPTARAGPRAAPRPARTRNSGSPVVAGAARCR